MEAKFLTFTLLISKLSREIRKIKTKEVLEYNLSSPHVTIIYLIYKNKGLTLKNVCDVTGEDKASISRSVEALRKKGLISQVDSNHYKNSINLSEQGLFVAKQISEKIDSVVALASNGISEHDRQIMYKCLNVISNNLDSFSRGE